MEPNNDIKQLDLLIAKIGGARTQSTGACELLLEHLRSARRDRLGGRSGEYHSSLQQAKISIACIADKTRRVEVKETLGNLIDPTK